MNDVTGPFAVPPELRPQGPVRRSRLKQEATAAAIRRLKRKYPHLLQSELADRFGLTQQWVSRILSPPDRNPDEA